MESVMEWDRTRNSRYMAFPIYRPMGRHSTMDKIHSKIKLQGMRCRLRKELRKKMNSIHNATGKKKI